MKTYAILWTIFRSNKLFSDVDTRALSLLADSAKDKEWEKKAQKVKPGVEELFKAMDNIGPVLTSPMVEVAPIPFDSMGNISTNNTIAEAMADTEKTMPIHDAAVAEQNENVKQRRKKKNAKNKKGPSN